MKKFVTTLMFSLKYIALGCAVTGYLLGRQIDVAVFWLVVAAWIDLKFQISEG